MNETERLAALAAESEATWNILRPHEDERYELVNGKGRAIAAATSLGAISAAARLLGIEWRYIIGYLCDVGPARHLSSCQYVSRGYLVEER